MLYQEFSNAIETGDIGMVENLLPFIMIYFQATKKFNYSILSIHFITCLRKLWSPGLRSYWRDMVVVNYSGKLNGFMAYDLLCEYLVREQKRFLWVTTNEYLWNTIVSLILILQDYWKIM